MYNILQVGAQDKNRNPESPESPQTSTEEEPNEPNEFTAIALAQSEEERGPNSKSAMIKAGVSSGILRLTERCLPTNSFPQHPVRARVCACVAPSPSSPTFPSGTFQINF